MEWAVWRYPDQLLVHVEHPGRGVRDDVSPDVSRLTQDFSGFIRDSVVTGSKQRRPPEMITIVIIRQLAGDFLLHSHPQRHVAWFQPIDLSPQVVVPPVGSLLIH